MANCVIFSFRLMEFLLSKKKYTYTMKIAREMCHASVLIHDDIWEDRFDLGFVKKQVIELLEMASKLLSGKGFVDCEGYDQALLESYIMNIEDRIANIKDNYIKGNPSASVPKDKLEELVQIALASKK